VIFVDNSAWYALSVPKDPNFAAATRFHIQHQYDLLTTDYVVDETLTLLRTSGHAHRALQFGVQLIDGREFARLHSTNQDDFLAAWDIFHRYSDKHWSFTDCVSFVVMQRLKIDTAFAFDQHFRQFGSINVVPA
jgi:predicted nucleic acid-binding protein